MYRLIFIILLSVASMPLCYAQHQNDTFHLYFDLNVPSLNQQAQKKLDSLVYHDRLRSGMNILIVGYADYLGTESHNQHLSEDRAASVATYLKGYEVAASDIKLCVGKGAIERGHPREGGYPTDRRVDIVVEHLGTTQHAKQPAAKPTNRVVLARGLQDISVYKPGETFVLNNIYFLPERHTIKDESMPVLKELLDALEENPHLKIQIEGHVCCIRDYPDAIDMDNGEPVLSVNRAKAIYKYLVDNGVDENRLKYVGYGHSRPVVAHEVTEADADKNRRVEIRILQK